MINVGKFGEVMLAGVAALALSATAIVAAVGPARALETKPVSLAQTQLSDQVRA